MTRLVLASTLATESTHHAQIHAVMRIAKAHFNESQIQSELRLWPSIACVDVVVSIPTICALMRMTSTARGMLAMPRRRATSGDWSSRIGCCTVRRALRGRAHLALPRPRLVADCASKQDVFGQDISESIVDGRADVIELGDESVLHPVDDHLGREDEENRLGSASLAMVLTERMRSSKLFPRVKLLGRKARSEPAISITLRIAMTRSIKPSWKRSTMSAVSLGGRQCSSPAHMIWNKFSFSNFLKTAVVS